MADIQIPAITYHQVLSDDMDLRIRPPGCSSGKAKSGTSREIRTSTACRQQTSTIE